ncbi:alpha/beta fold hydrolase [Streptomyces sp. CB02460]|uniref:alpha/beta fold hydrolase n=1 Tax=Streptomyces sp. CB02460 TaxID=1703941 RepID=UPI00093889CF|nr:alpha/beta hydrolase [Streptomyces sp. CB02460]OKJ78666.1 alpha/beta hydrolase [Streptomyces sp. CB02460]
MTTHTFTASDGTPLAYRVYGDGTGDPLLCVPGGPTDSRYLGDLGGLSAHRRLVVPDLRGNGGSAVPEDASTYRCDRLAEDVEALRRHLGLARVDLLGHSAGANIAVRYAERHPDRIGRLALIAPSTRAVGIDITGDERRALARLRSGEPWFPAAFPALEAITRGNGTDWAAVEPFFHGRWDDAARRLQELGRPGNPESVALFGAEGAFDPPATRKALASLAAPVLLLAGAYDLNSPPRAVAALGDLFRDAALVVQPGAGHYPWADDAKAFGAAVAGFLGGRG